MDDREMIKRLPERDVERGTYDRIVHARVENARTDLLWLVRHGRMSDEFTRYAVNALANVSVLARRLGV